MTGTQDTVSVEIRALVDQFIDDLKKAGSAAGEAGDHLKDKLGGGAKEAGGHIKDFSAVLREFKSEQVSDARTARFFAGELLSIVPAADGTKGALQDLISIGLSGSAFSAGIEAVKLITGLMHEFDAESHKAAEETKKFAEDSAAALKTLREEIEAGLLIMHGATDADMKQRQSLAAVQDKIRNNEQDIAAARAVIATNTAGMTEIDKAAWEQDKDAAYDRLAHLAAERKGLEAKKQAVLDLFEVERQEKALQAENEIDPGVLAANTQQALDARLAADKRLQQEHFALLRVTATQERQIQIDLEEKIADIKLQYRDVADKKAMNKEIQNARDLVAIKGSLLRRAAEEQEQLISPQALEADRERVQLWDQQAMDLREMLRDEENMVSTEILLADAERRKKDALKEQKDTWKELKPEIASIATNFAQMALDGKSLDDAMKDIAKQALAFGIQMGIRGLLGLGGPMSFLAFEQGGDIPSAATGLDIPASNTGTPILVHGGEAIVTHSTTDRLKNFLNSWESGGGGAGGVVNHFHGVWDGESVRRFVNSQDYARAQRDARRMGRLP
jgi:hypothetical protein